MAFPVKQVWTSEERLRITEEVEKNPSEKRTDVAKRLGLPPSTLNKIIAKGKIREHALGSGSCV
jgi:transposase-like protein